SNSAAPNGSRIRRRTNPQLGFLPFPDPRFHRINSAGGKERKDHMNPLIQLKAQLQRFAKALLDQTKGNTLGEISKLIGCALLLTLVLRSGSACNNFQWWGTGTPTPT